MTAPWSMMTVSKIKERNDINGIQKQKILGKNMRQMLHI